jgi:hypothetical protein
MTSEKTRLETARRYVFDAHKIVEHQRVIIEQKKRLGVNIAGSENLLKTMEQALAYFEDDFNGLMDGTRL